MSFVRRRSLLAGLTTALVLAGCATPMTAPVSAPATLGAFDANRGTSALYTFFALDNDLDHGDGIAQRLTVAASRSRTVSAASLYDGEGRNDTLFFTGQPGTRGSYKEVSEADTGTASALANFLNQAVQAAPGNRKLLSMADHGGGIIRGICSDWNGPGGKKIIHVNEVAAAMRATPVDIMLFDACFMNMAEVAYELKDVAKVVIGAQTTTRGDFPYESIISSLDRHAQADNVTVSHDLTRVIDGGARYSGVAFGAVDTSKAPAMAQAVANLSQVLVKHLPQHKAEMVQAINGATRYANETSPGMAMYNDYKDFGSVMGNLARIPNPEIRDAALAAKAAGAAAVIHHTARGSYDIRLDGATGTALYATTSGGVEAKYLQRSWNRDTGWGDFLVKLNSRGGYHRPIVQDKYPFAFPSRHK